MKIKEEITTAMESKKYTIGVFIDFKIAFDTIDHTIFISKLYTYGLIGVNWLSSYLDNRQQYVQFAGNRSKNMKIECGVPQGSVLGPKLLFCISMIYVKCQKYCSLCYLQMTQFFLVQEMT